MEGKRIRCAVVQNLAIERQVAGVISSISYDVLPVNQTTLILEHCILRNEMVLVSSVS